MASWQKMLIHPDGGTIGDYMRLSSDGRPYWDSYNPQDFDAYFFDYAYIFQPNNLRRKEFWTYGCVPGVGTVTQPTDIKNTLWGNMGWGMHIAQNNWYGIGRNTAWQGATVIPSPTGVGLTTQNKMNKYPEFNRYFENRYHQEQVSNWVDEGSSNEDGSGFTASPGCFVPNNVGDEPWSKNFINKTFTLSRETATELSTFGSVGFNTTYFLNKIDFEASFFIGNWFNGSSFDTWVSSEASNLISQGAGGHQGLQIPTCPEYWNLLIWYAVGTDYGNSDGDITFQIDGIQDATDFGLAGVGDPLSNKSICEGMGLKSAIDGVDSDTNFTTMQSPDNWNKYGVTAVFNNTVEPLSTVDNAYNTVIFGATIVANSAHADFTGGQGLGGGNTDSFRGVSDGSGYTDFSIGMGHSPDFCSMHLNQFHVSYGSTGG